MDKKAIYEFSIKWINKFKDKDWNFHDIFESDEFPNECWSLGFEMDCGNMFAEAYGSDSLRELVALQRIIKKVDNIKILGSGIFSNWRYFNHWAYSGPSEEDIKWFILALTRLSELTKE